MIVHRIYGSAGVNASVRLHHCSHRYFLSDFRWYRSVNTSMNLKVVRVTNTLVSKGFYILLDLDDADRIHDIYVFLSLFFRSYTSVWSRQAVRYKFELLESKVKREVGKDLWSKTWIVLTARFKDVVIFLLFLDKQSSSFRSPTTDIAFLYRKAISMRTNRGEGWKLIQFRKAWIQGNLIYCTTE